MITRTCLFCGKEFQTKPSEVKKGNGKYCNRECFNKTPKSEEMRKKASEALKGIKLSKERCRNMSDAHKGKSSGMKGKHHSPETKLKMSKSGKGRIFTEEHKRKIGESNKGKIISIESRKKSSETRIKTGLSKGKNNSQWLGGKEASLERRKKNLKYRLNQRIGCLIRNGLKNEIKNGRHWCDLVGYDFKQLKKRLEKTMPEGYTWNDFMKNNELHIDHIIPISVFNFDKPEHIDFKLCWALNNLQLLPAKENLRKSAKLDNSFQPSMRL